MTPRELLAVKNGFILFIKSYQFPLQINTIERIVVYYESMKRELKIKPIYECRCDGRLQTKRFTRLSHTGLVVELEHQKIKTRLTFCLSKSQTNFVLELVRESRAAERGVFFCHFATGEVNFICSRIKKRRKPRVKIVTLKLCGV
jgi:hypothetical protein